MRANQFLSASFLHIDESDGTDAKYLENRTGSLFMENDNVLDLLLQE